MTNRERQARYRASTRDPDGNLQTRFQVYLSPTANRILGQLARDMDISKKAVIERLLRNADPGDSHIR